jgi:RNA polymerase sigma-19 factor, ECF subfamily
MKKTSNGAHATCLADVAAELYGNRLHRFLLRRMGPNAAEDLVQEVYVRLLHVPLDQFIRNPQGYIFTVARRVLWEFTRRERRHRTSVCVDSEHLKQVVDAPGQLQPDEPAHWASSAELLQRFFDQLRPELQAALMLHLDGCSYAQIATKLEVSERAARRYVDDARHALRQVLATEIGTETDGQRPQLKRRRHE